MKTCESVDNELSLLNKKLLPSSQKYGLDQGSVIRKIFIRILDPGVKKKSMLPPHHLLYPEV